jgi:hypothetical protein
VTVAVLSSVYGGYDHPIAPAEQDVACDWILVSVQDHDCHPWKVVVEPRPQLHPRLAAKVAKCRPDLYTDADVTIWVDASIHITSPGFVSWCVAELGESEAAQIPHPMRRRISDEAQESHGMPKYAGLPVFAQVDSYLSAGYPDDWGLWATGLIVYKGRSRFGDAWLREQMRWTYQDQLSEAPVLHAHGIRPVDLTGGLFNHPMFTIRGHRDHL